MAEQQVLPDVTPAQVINALRAMVPEGCYVLFTPYDSMFVSPDPAEIKRSIDTLTSHTKESQQ